MKRIIISLFILVAPFAHAKQSSSLVLSAVVPEKADVRVQVSNGKLLIENHSTPGLQVKSEGRMPASVQVVAP